MVPDRLGAQVELGRDLLRRAALLEKTQNLKGVYSPSYSWGPKERNGFPDAGIAINRASTFNEGSFERAPQ